MYSTINDNFPNISRKIIWGEYVGTISEGIYHGTQIFLFLGGIINAMAVKPILLMGNPVLYETSEEISKDERDQTFEIISDLRDTLEDFRKTNGFGRAISAVQIGVKKRIIFMKTSNEERIIINPELEFLTTEQIELWDDCFSLPNIRVRVKRYKSVRVSYLGSNWQPMYEIFTDDLSELIQHEYDHLEGILAVARAIDKNSFAFESEMSHHTNT